MKAKEKAVIDAMDKAIEAMDALAAYYGEKGMTTRRAQMQHYAAAIAEVLVCDDGEAGMFVMLQDKEPE